MSEETVSAHKAVELVLAHRAANEPGFVERLAMDPKSVVAPVIAEVLEDDGDLDLTDIAVNVHIETPRSLHFVVDTDDPAEVAGFAKFSGDLRAVQSRLQFDVLKPTFIGGGTFESATQTSCVSVPAEGEKCTPTGL